MGDGFFQIQQQDGTIAYTRDGAFKLSGTGQLVTSTGFLLEPNITIPNNASSLTIGRDGTVSVEARSRRWSTGVGSNSDRQVH